MKYFLLLCLVALVQSSPSFKDTVTSPASSSLLKSASQFNKHSYSQKLPGPESAQNHLFLLRGGFKAAGGAGRKGTELGLTVLDVSDVLVVQPMLQPVLQDTVAASLSAGAALVWVKIWTDLASAGALDPKVSRKIIHCGSGPLFLLVWPFFSLGPAARVFAALVPLIQAVRLYRAGRSGDGGAPADGAAAAAGPTNPLVKAVSRSGAAEEALGGPFLYCLVLLAATAGFWRESAAGAVAICQMAAGDGMADLVGRRWGRGAKWPWSAEKSVAGTAGFVAGASLVTYGVLAWLHFSGFFPELALGFGGQAPWAAAGGAAAAAAGGAGAGALAGKVLLVSVACAAVEVAPVDAWDDNLSVPLVAAALTYLLF